MEHFNILIHFDYTLMIVTIGAALLGAVSGSLGTYAVLRRQSLLGDAISHAALPRYCHRVPAYGKQSTPDSGTRCSNRGVVGHTPDYECCKFDAYQIR